MSGKLKIIHFHIIYGRFSVISEVNFDLKYRQAVLERF